MSKLGTRVALYLAGAVTVILVLVVLAIAGVVPVKTERTTVVQPQPGSASATTTAVAEGGTLTATQIYQKYAAGVVEVLSTFQQTGGGFFGQPSTAQALGSGFVVSIDGYILTNAHVVSDSGQSASSVAVVFKTIGTQTKRVTAKVVGIDNTSDVALLKIDATQVGKLDPLVLGSSAGVQVGETVVAIGNPLGYDFSLTEGVVSATNRNLQSPNGSVISNGIQTDAAINEGNSGGPLIDSQGRVIGVNEQIASQSGGNQGLGFAVPIDTAVNVMNQLKKSGTVTYAYLGIQGQTLTADVAKALGLKTSEGVLVAQVSAGSPAAKVGIKGGQKQTVLQGQVYVAGGDVIKAIDGQAMTSMDQLAGTISSHKPGETVTLTILRGSATITLKVTLGTRPAGS
jgi:putative serine protease PepD